MACWNILCSLVCCGCLLLACNGAGDDDAPNDATAAHLCNLYDALHRDCGYQKFATRSDCERALSDLSGVESTQWDDFYGCLGACRSSPASLDELSGMCAASAFGSSGEWTDLCARTCERIGAVRCPRAPGQADCVSACQQMIGGDCRTSVTNLDACMPAYACDATGGIVSSNCADELAGFEGCAKALGVGGSALPGAPADFAARAATAFCSGLRGCCAAANIAFAETACESAALTSLPPRIVPQGRVVWDPAAGERCIAAYAALGSTCAPTLADRAAFAPACDRLFAPTVQPGEICQYDEECVDIGGARAVCRADGVNPSDLRICSEDPNRRPTQHGRAGDPCSESCTVPELDDCSGGPAPAGSVNAACYASEGFACDFVSATCVALSTVGQPCGQGCGGGSYCDGTICVEQKPDGAACEASNECATWACSGGGCGLSPLASSWLCGSGS